MTLSKRVVETLLDLVEIKLSCMEVHDREDTREATCLEACRQELKNLLTGGASAANGSAVASFTKPAKGRRPAAV